MALYQVFLESTHITYRQFGPINNVVFEDKRDRGNIFYRKSLVNDLIFGQTADYTEIFALTAYENEEVTVTIKVDCEGVLTEYWKGTFTIVDCKVDIDKCTIEVNPRPLDRYSCILSKLDTEVSMWDPLSDYITVLLADESFLYYQPKSFTVTTVGQGNFDPDIPGPYGPEWWLEYPIIWASETDNGDGTWTYTKLWHHHLVGFGTDTVPPDPSGLWYKWKNTTAVGEPPLPFVGAWRWVRIPNENAKGLAPLRAGKPFVPTLKAAVLSLDCSIPDISSNFFQYNGMGTPPSNTPYTYASQNNQYLTIHQKSDVKRPYDTNKALAKVWRCKFRDLLEDLKTIYNVYWDIDDDNNLVLEHISFFTDQAEIDLTDKCKGEKLKYDYNDAEAIQEEQYKFMDAATSEYFRGFPIGYLTNTAEVKENRARIFSTDVYYVQDSSNAENIQDNGFVLVSNSNGGSVRNLNKANTPLSWPQLHEKLHRHNRPYQEFYLNDMLDSALYVVKKKQQEQFFVFMCCNQIKDTDDVWQDYDPKKSIITNLGTGEIESARYDVANDTLTLKLQY